MLHEIDAGERLFVLVRELPRACEHRRVDTYPDRHLGEMTAAEVTQLLDEQQLS